MKRVLCRGCKHKHASFSLPGQYQSHCKSCATPDMVGQQQRNKCRACGRKSRAYGFPEEKASHCKQCAQPGMQRKYGLCKVCHRTCTSYGWGGKLTHCGSCKEDGMIPSKACQCGAFACWGYSKRTHCYACKTSDMVCPYLTLCKSCGLFPGRSNLRKGEDKPSYLCSYCAPQSRYAKGTKESRTVAALAELVPSATAVLNNKQITGGCSKRRPDLLYDAGTHFVAVEIDEDQHEQYDRGCEHRRMLEIGQDCGMPTHFIRYNPDAWKMNGAIREITEETRLAVLARSLENALAHPAPPGVTAAWLFYNDKDVGCTTVVQ